jgi:polysaccharide biosynthesis/export protein
MKNRNLFLVLMGSSLAIGGCSMLPASGPGVAELTATAATTDRLEKPAFQYALVDISQRVLSVLTDIDPGSFFRTFGVGKGSPTSIFVGVGDSVQVTVFESSAGGLFIPTDAGARAGNFVTMPSQAVDQTGLITVPYAGQINVKGRSLPDIENEIETKLASRAIEPRVIVSLTAQTSSQVTVIGQVSAATKVNINPAGDRVLDVLSKSGGIANAGYETFVTLQRKGKTATVYFLNLLKNSRENVFVQPEDILYVSQDKRSFTAFGATGHVNQFFFEQERLLLTDAVGKAGGLLDNQANPRWVLLYRPESRSRLEKMSIDLTMFPESQKVIPTIYRVNLQDPSGFFAARAFYMQNRDIIYVTNADKVELFKFLDLVTGVTGAVGSVSADVVAVNNASKVLKNW